MDHGLHAQDSVHVSMPNTCTAFYKDLHRQKVQCARRVTHSRCAKMGKLSKVSN
jgi:hypothetical protein